MGVGESKSATTRRYSRASGFSHIMDNIVDRKNLKIKMKQTNVKEDGSVEGTFSLYYLDDSSDDFMRLKSNFTYTGTCALRFSVSCFTSNALCSRGAPIPPRFVRASCMSDPTPTPQPADSGTKNDQGELILHFRTQSLTCKLSEDGAARTWVITPHAEPDSTTQEQTDIISWEWDPSKGSKSATVQHTAPLGALDIFGEEDASTGNMNLKFRIPQLAAAWSTPVVALNPSGGWELERAKMIM